MRNAHVELERLLSCLGSEDKGHLDRLKVFAKAQGIDPPGDPAAPAAP